MLKQMHSDAKEMLKRNEVIKEKCEGELQPTLRGIKAKAEVTVEKMIRVMNKMERVAKLH